ncbi:cation channel family protein [Stylonychia lemnae]|uniref:Cation channel family protein n=1 Tax=Stylonychia lemnae TaxID=5949 RepID=A0A078A3U7_STYLE|nr:cation channel family protein [Stylonychia lemnae]|eukprot:CDW76539.1 cation channel family protein [Stylonychia lemnae]
MLACTWCLLGLSDQYLPPEQRESWVYIQNSNGDYDFNEKNSQQIYIFAVYWILETLTTVGYGDYVGTTRNEYLFTMVLEDLIDEKLSQLDIWIKKIEKSNKPYYIPPDLYSVIKQYVQDAFLHDFNLIIEEFPYYYQISPKMQTELCTTIFKEFQQSFRLFFDFCERGFINELIINMYCRIYQPEATIVPYGSKFSEIYFIREGGVRMFNKFRIQDFMFLPQYQIFGDYQILYDLKSNIVFQTAKNYPVTRFMCVSKKVLLRLCSEYPITGDNLRQRGLERRKFFMDAMEKLDKLTPLKALGKSLKEKFKIKLQQQLGLLGLQAPESQKNLIQQLGQNSQEQLQNKESIENAETGEVQFYTDEEPNIEQGEKETVNSVIKRVNKKTELIFQAMKISQEKMDHNQKILKRYLIDGYKPAIAFGTGLQYVSQEFLKLAEMQQPTEVKEQISEAQMNKLRALQAFASRVNKARIEAELETERQKQEEEKDKDKDKDKQNQQAASISQKTEGDDEVIDKELKALDIKDQELKQLNKVESRILSINNQQ